MPGPQPKGKITFAGKLRAAHVRPLHPCTLVGGGVLDAPTIIPYEGVCPMELLCVLAAVAALFCGCTVLTLKCRVPASVAPLTALSLIVAVLTLAAMAGVLYPITWAVTSVAILLYYRFGRWLHPPKKA